MKLTRKQLEGRKEKAIQFVRDVLNDPERADEIADESLEDYAERRKIEITNPTRRETVPSTKRELQERIAELEAENEELQDALDEISEIASPEEEEEEGEDLGE